MGILLTHGHYDHIGWVKAIAKKFGAKIVIGREDAEQLYDIHTSLALARSMSEEIYVMQPDILVKEGDQLEVGELLFLVYDTPGHTKGDVTYQCGNLLFTGDTMFAGDVGRCDLYGGDYRAILRSVKKLAALPGDYRVLPGHGPESTLEQERRYNQYVRMNPDDPVY